MTTSVSRNRTHLGWILPLVAVVTSCALPLDARQVAEGAFEDRLSVTGPLDLDVRSGSGGIEIRTGEAGTVHVMGSVRARANTVDAAAEKISRLEADAPITQNGNTVRIGRIADRDLRRNVSISYVITVPEEASVYASVAAGRITIDGVSGPVEAEAGSGRVTVTNIEHSVSARTVTGGIDVDAVAGDVDVETGSGRMDLSRLSSGLTAATVTGGITIDGVTGPVEAETGSGRVTVTNIERGVSARTVTGRIDLDAVAGNVDVETGSGHLELARLSGGLTATTITGGISAEGRPSDEWVLRTGSGSVNVTLPQDLAFEVSARSGSGGVTVNHPVTTTGRMPRNSLEGTVRGGGVRVAVETGVGAIRIE